MARRRYSSWSYNNYFHTPTAGEIERTANKALAEAKKKGLDYHPVVIPGMKIAHSWWGKSWCDNLERYADYVNRLPRGRSYVRHNAVIDLQIDKGKAHGKVQGSSLYKVDIQFDPLDSKTEKELSKICSEQIQNVEDLVSGKFPETLKDRLFAKGGLFPSPREIHFKCSCPDWASMCKHVAAVMYGIGARLDAEPLGFFDLRGISTEDFVAKAVANKVEGMLQNAARKSSRVIDDDSLQDLFGLELSGPMEIPGEQKHSADTAEEYAEPKRRRGRPPKAAAQATNSIRSSNAKNAAVKKVAAVVRDAEEQAKRRGRPPKTLKQPEKRLDIRSTIRRAGYSEKVKDNLLVLADELSDEVFGYVRVKEILDCSVPTAAAYIKKLHEELKVIAPAEGQSRGKYRFLKSG